MIKTLFLGMFVIGTIIVVCSAATCSSVMNTPEMQEYLEGRRERSAANDFITEELQRIFNLQMAVSLGDRSRARKPEPGVERALGNHRYQIISKIDIGYEAPYGFPVDGHMILGNPVHFNAIAEHPNGEGEWIMEYLELQTVVVISSED